MLSGRGLCDELITRPEESYRLWCVVVCDLETFRIGPPYIYINIYDISSLRVNTSVTFFIFLALTIYLLFKNTCTLKRSVKPKYFSRIYFYWQNVAIIQMCSQVPSTAIKCISSYFIYVKKYVYYFVFPKEADLTEVALNLRENEDPSDTNRNHSIASGN